jgi:hypothetical protein
MKDTYKGNAEAKLLDVKDSIQMLIRQLERKGITEQQLLERLKQIEKDIDQTNFFLSLV